VGFETGVLELSDTDVVVTAASPASLRHLAGRAWVRDRDRWPTARHLL